MPTVFKAVVAEILTFFIFFFNLIQFAFLVCVAIDAG